MAGCRAEILQVTIEIGLATIPGRPDRTHQRAFGPEKTAQTNETP